MNIKRIIGLLALLVLISFSAFGDVAVPKEDFEVALSPTTRYSFKAGQEYPILSEANITYVVKYEVASGIFERIQVLKSKVNVISAEEQEKVKAEKERIKKEQEKAEQEYIENQKAKGFTRVEGFWMREEFKELGDLFSDANKMRDDMVALSKLNNKLEKTLIKKREYYTKLGEKVIKMQEKEAVSSKQIEEARKRVNSKSSADVDRFNKKVLAHNKLNTAISKTVLKLQKGTMAYNKQAAQLQANQQKYATDLPIYQEKLWRLEAGVKKYSTKVACPEDEEFLSFLKEVVVSFKDEVTNQFS